MTRINVVDPNILHPLHLLAEYRELPRVFPLASKARSRGASPALFKIPLEYTLGVGHVKFFYTRLKYLCDRQTTIVKILQSRGINVTYRRSLAESFSEMVNTEWWGDYTPTNDAVLINLARLRERMPLFYATLNP